MRFATLVHALLVVALVGATGATAIAQPGNGVGGDVGDGGNVDDQNGDFGGGGGPQLSWSLSSNDPGNHTASPGDTHVVAMVAKAVTNQHDVQIESLTVQITGTVLQQFDINAIRLAQDTNANGQQDGGEELFEFTTPFGEGEDTIVFDFAGGPGSLLLTASSTTHFIVEVDVSGTAIPGKEIIPRIVSADLFEGFNSNLPLPGSTITLVDDSEAVLTLVSVNPDATDMPAGGTATVLGMRVVAGGAPLQVSGVGIQAEGELVDTVDILICSLVRDANGNGLIDGSDEPLFSGPFVSDNGTIDILLPTPLQLSNGGSSTLLAGVTLSTTAPVGKLFHLEFVAVSHTADTVVGALPMAGTVMTVTAADEGDGDSDDDGGDGNDSGSDNGFDDLSIGTSLGAGCSAGTGSASTLLLLVLALGMLVVVRKR